MSKTGTPKRSQGVHNRRGRQTGPRARAPGDEAPRRSGPYALTFDDRRSRILGTAWELIASQGDEFSLQQLSKLADVSLRTIYNAFGDRNGVIEAAISAHYDAIFEGDSRTSARSCTLQQGLQITRDVASEICRVRGWSRTAAHLFFSPHASASMKHTLHSMPLRIANAWLRSAEVDLSCVAAIGSETLANDYAYSQWSIVNAWASGSLSDVELLQKMCLGLIIVALAAGNDDGRNEARRLAAEVQAEGRMRTSTAAPLTG